MAKNDFQYGGWNSYTLQCGTIIWHWFRQVTALCNVAYGCGIIHQVAVGTWHVALGWHVIEFARWQHPAMWHVALESWQWIRPVAAPCNVAGGSGMTCHWIHPKVRHTGILLLVSISAISPQSTCHSSPVCEILSKSDHPRQKKMTSCRFSRWRISAILDFRGPIMGSLKNPRTRSYRSSIKTMAVNCLVFEKIAFFLYFGDRQTDEQMDRFVAWSRSRCRGLTSVSETIQKPPLVEAQNAVGKQKKYGEERYSIWRPFAILNFRELIMGSFKSPCRNA